MQNLVNQKFVVAPSEPAANRTRPNGPRRPKRRSSRGLVGHAVKQPAHTLHCRGRHADLTSIRLAWHSGLLGRWTSRTPLW